MAHISYETTRQERSDGSTIYTLSADHGELVGISRHDSGWFCIANLDVDEGYRRQGIGKALLRGCLEIAVEDQAQLVYAAIVSRECLDAMVGVFGADNVSVTATGEYEGSAEHSPTSAFLRYSPTLAISDISAEQT